MECLHCVLLDRQFIYANADQNVEVGVVAATRPVDAIMAPAVAALHSARRNTRLRCRRPWMWTRGRLRLALSTRNLHNQLSPPTAEN
jgi:hypothetical protein